MRHNEIADICRKIVAKVLKVEEGKIPSDEWDFAIYDFAKEASAMGYPEDYIRKEFQYRVEDLVARVNTWKAQAWSGAMQRHHDYFVYLFRQGALPPEDVAQYDLAIEREHNGEVKQLADNAVSFLANRYPQ